RGGVREGLRGRRLRPPRRGAPERGGGQGDQARGEGPVHVRSGVDRRRHQSAACRGVGAVLRRAAAGEEEDPGVGRPEPGGGLVKRFVSLLPALAQLAAVVIVVAVAFVLYPVAG